MHGYSINRILSVAAVIFVLVAGVVCAAIWKLHDDAVDEAEQGVSSLAGILSEQVQQSAQAIDLAINEIQGVLAVDGREQLAARALAPEVEAVLEKVSDRNAAIDLITVESADGLVLVTSRGAPLAPISHFLPIADFLRHNRSRETFTGEPRVSEATGAMVVDFVRRLSAPDGGYLGLVRVSVTPQSLVSTYSPLSALKGRSYALFSREGSILVRFPDQFGTAGARLPANSPWYRAVAAGGGVYETRSVFDQSERIIAARPLKFSPLVVSVSILRETALSHWRKQASAILACAVLGLVIAIFLTKALIGQFRQVAEKERALVDKSNELALSNARFATALGNMSQGLVVLDRDGRVVISNRQYSTIYGLDPDQVRPGTPAAEILRMRAARGLYAGLTADRYVRDSLSRRFADRRVDHLSDGRSILVNHAVCPDGGMVVTHEDVTEREEANERIAHMAMHDELTQLGNRALFRRKIEELRAGIGQDIGAVAVMLIDLDDFKPVNDSYGHVVGDAVLRECASRLREIARDADVVARLGGDEFAVALGATEAAAFDAVAFARRTIARLSEPYFVHEHALEIGACAGVAVHEDATLSIDDMMRRADLALYAAKAEGARRARVFEPQMELESITRRELALDLAQAIGAGDLRLVYQPVVESDTQRVQHMEALVRWRHPVKGDIPPQKFVRLAEENRLIEALGAWVVQRACADLRSMPPTIGVAVNVSPLQLADPHFSAIVLHALEMNGVAPQRLELEITESVLLQDKGDSLNVLRDLRARGVAIALDDFGTGYSSMSYLKRFPFDRLKIDRSFVIDIARDSGSTAIIAATVSLARAFEIEVTAEGVETEAQRQALRAAGIRSMQGYLFGRPADLQDALAASGLGDAQAVRVA